METAKKQTVVVEVMALVGGHLPLPKVRLSKYIPADHNTSHRMAADNCAATHNNNPASAEEIISSTEETKHFKAVIRNESDANLDASSNQHSSNINGKELHFMFA